MALANQILYLNFKYMTGFHTYNCFPLASTIHTIIYPDKVQNSYFSPSLPPINNVVFMKRIENKPLRFIFITAEGGKGDFSTIFQEFLTCLAIFGTDCSALLPWPIRFGNNTLCNVVPLVFHSRRISCSNKKIYVFMRTYIFSRKLVYNNFEFLVECDV